MSGLQFELTGTVANVEHKESSTGNKYALLHVLYDNNNLEADISILIPQSLLQYVGPDDVGKNIVVNGYMKNYKTKTDYVNQSYVASFVTVENPEEKMDWG